MIARTLSFFAPAAVMSAWGMIMLHTIASGHLNRLLNPMFRSYVLAAAILLLLLSAAYVLLFQPANNPAPAMAPTGRVRQLLRWAALLLPIVAASILSPDALSSTTMANRANSTAGALPMPTMSATSAKNVAEALAADPNQPVPVEVTDLITLSHSPAQMQGFAGRKVRAVGFIVHPGTGAPKLMRWLMWCCAADAQPVSVQLTGAVLPATTKDDQWFEITGTAQFPSTLGQVVPQIEVESVKPTDEPDEPYLSP